ncbi:Oidioi.mRNA.OKI2018_I69.chr2.g8337.t1.cds [Oikopleura dioica]|uniref:Oidioi.mRNA.OKI2018_I69.chr2.g8337.t1.cds n=1 Tax=Oikopleura dioica TaxID=34765 RepID=A0ABN7TF57_OIKDI|nr:Oidioi.mRNA.OKI2018_I69.chr2.g8337.t1.cds [Oikopleura dioica]
MGLDATLAPQYLMFKDEVSCPICKEILDAPFEVQCCQGHMCQSCFMETQGRSDECPLCRKSQFTGRKGRTMSMFLEKFQLVCNHCHLTIPYAQFNEHKKNCLPEKQCEHCAVHMSESEFERHTKCTLELQKKLDLEICKRFFLLHPDMEARDFFQMLRDFNPESVNLSSMNRANENTFRSVSLKELFERIRFYTIDDIMARRNENADDAGDDIEEIEIEHQKPRSRSSSTESSNSWNTSTTLKKNLPITNPWPLKIPLSIFSVYFLHR